MCSVDLQTVVTQVLVVLFVGQKFDCVLFY